MRQQQLNQLLNQTPTAQRSASPGVLLSLTEEKRTLSGQTYGKTYFKENFIPLLELGQHYEKMAVNRIIKFKKYDNPKITFNNDSRYDIKINSKTYEVKTDIKAVNSGNIFIEYICKNKLSGISITEAKYYLIVIPYQPEETFLLIKTRKLKQLIEDQKYFKHFTPHNKNNFTGGYIFTVEALKAIGKLI